MQTLHGAVLHPLNELITFADQTLLRGTVPVAETFDVVLRKLGRRSAACSEMRRLAMPLPAAAQGDLLAELISLVAFFEAVRLAQLADDPAVQGRIIQAAVGAEAGKYAPLLSLLPRNLVDAVSARASAPPDVSASDLRLKPLARGKRLIVIDIAGAWDRAEARLLTAVLRACAERRSQRHR